jgi:hypothetical protein
MEWTFHVISKRGYKGGLRVTSVGFNSYNIWSIRNTLVSRDGCLR